MRHGGVVHVQENAVTRVPSRKAYLLAYLHVIYVVQMIAIPISLGKDSLKHQLKLQKLVRHVRVLVALSVVALIMVKVCSRQNQHLMETKGRPMTPTVKKDTGQAERQQDKQNKCDVRTCSIEQNQGSAVL